MIPIYYSESDDNWHKADVTNSDPNNKWYDYDQKMWANSATIYNEPNYYTKKVTEKEVSFEKNITVTDGYIIENKNVVTEEGEFGSDATFTFTTGDTGGEFSFDYFAVNEKYGELYIYVNGVSISDYTGIDPLVSGTYSIDAKANTAYTIRVAYYANLIASPNGYAAIGDFVLPDNLSKDFTFTSTRSYPFVKTTKEVVGPSRMVYSSNWFDVESGRYNLGSAKSGIDIGDFICTDFFTTEGCNVVYEIKEITGNMVTKANVYEKQTMRDYYQSAPVGTVISMNDINAMFVWVPRYKYTYFKGQTKCSSLTNPTITTNPECYEYVYQDRFHDTLYNHIMGDWEDATIAESILTSWKNGEKDNYYKVTFEYFVNPENGIIGGDFSTFFGDYPAAKSPVEIKIDFEKGTASTGTIKCVEKIAYNSTITGNTSEVCTDVTNGGLVVGKSTYTHPAFTFGNEELSGIWVGKFEANNSNSETIKPDIIIESVPTFEYVRKMELAGNAYGFPQNGTVYNASTGEITDDSNNLDTHSIKNTEWGAVAYLSHSKYGKCTDSKCEEIYINNSCAAEYGNNLCTTINGRSGGAPGGYSTIKSAYPSYNSNTLYTAYGYYTYDGYLLDYNTNNKSSTRDLSKVSSTTGNIYGIYDMSGGIDEFVMGAVADTSNKFAVTLADKYYDKYTYRNNNNSEVSYARLGDATLEMFPSFSPDREAQSWYIDYFEFPNNRVNLFMRGGYSRDGLAAGIFYIGAGSGELINYVGRIVLTVASK